MEWDAEPAVDHVMSQLARGQPKIIAGFSPAQEPVGQIGGCNVPIALAGIAALACR
jgi:hypothetical protein